MADVSENPFSSSMVATYARDGDLEYLVEAITNGAPVDVPGVCGWYPIHEAAFNNRCECLEFLLKHEKTDINRCTHDFGYRSMRDGHTALYLAAKNGFLDCIRILLEHGADVKRSSDGGSLVMAATKSGSADCVQALINAGAAVDIPDDRNWYPFHEAAFNNHCACLEILLKYGKADINSCTRDVRFDFDRTALYLAAAKGYVGCVRILLEYGADVNRSSEGQSLVMAATESGHSDCVQVLIDAGAPVDVPDDFGCFPIHRAASENHCECLEILLQHKKTDVNWQRDNGETPLILAARKGCVRCVRLLLNSGANVTLRSFHDESPVFAAAQSGNSNCIQALINAGAPVDVPTNYGSYPIHKAASKNHWKCLKVLLQHEKTNVNWCDADGNTALDMVVNNNFAESISVFLEYGANVNLDAAKLASLLLAAIEHGSSDCIKTFIKAGADVTRKDWYERTPLHAAVGHGMSDTVHLLLSAGASAFAEDFEKETAAIVACRNGNDACLQMLVNAVDDKPALLNKRNCKGRSCVHIASSFGSESCLKILLENGADINICTNNGEHPISVLAQHNRIGCLRLIMPHVNKSVVLHSSSDPVFVSVNFFGNLEVLKLLLADGYPVNRSTDSAFMIRSLYFRERLLRPLLKKPMITPLGCAVHNYNLKIAETLLNLGADMQPDDTAVCSPFLLAIPHKITPEILHAFLRRGVDLNSIDSNSLVQIPDAFVVGVLRQDVQSRSEKKLLAMLKAGLKPCLEQWCSTKIQKCSTMNWGPDNNSFLGEISRILTPQKLENLIRLVLPFSECGLPNCCDAWRNAFGDQMPDFGMWQDRPLSLMHLCRMKIREQVTSKQLFTQDWIEKITFPENLKKYLTYE